jgi:hypothetical protein
MTGITATLAPTRSLIPPTARTISSRATRRRPTSASMTTRRVRARPIVS